jgi:hypothetical protein
MHAATDAHVHNARTQSGYESIGLLHMVCVQGHMLMGLAASPSQQAARDLSVDCAIPCREVGARLFCAAYSPVALHALSGLHSASL